MPRVFIGSLGRRVGGVGGVGGVDATRHVSRLRSVTLATAALAATSWMPSKPTIMENIGAE
jgi:hypothetical protein